MAGPDPLLSLQAFAFLNGNAAFHMEGIEPLVNFMLDCVYIRRAKLEEAELQFRQEQEYIAR